MKDIKNFGSYLRSYRKIIGYGLREFARQLDTCPSNLSAMELGQRPVPKNFNFAKAMELLGIRKGTPDWELFLHLATQSGSIDFLRNRVIELEEEIRKLKSLLDVNEQKLQVAREAAGLATRMFESSVKEMMEKEQEINHE